MKRIIHIVGFVLCLTSFTLPSWGQTQDIEQLTLDIEKLSQFKKILQDLYDGYKVLEEGYNKIRDVASGNFNLHKAFLDGLLAVNPQVKQYVRVTDIISAQLVLVSEYKTAFSLFKGCGQFTDGELSYLSNVYGNLINESVGNLNALIMVVTAGQLRMSDDERLHAIDQIYSGMESKLQFLRDFNNKTHVLALQRAKETGEIEGLRNVFGIK